MAAPQFVGFSPFRRTRIGAVCDAARLCLDRAQEAACVSTEDFQFLMQDYFAILTTTAGEPAFRRWEAVRHLVLKSLASMSLLLRQARLKVYDLAPKERVDRRGECALGPTCAPLDYGQLPLAWPLPPPVPPPNLPGAASHRGNPPPYAPPPVVPGPRGPQPPPKPKRFSGPIPSQWLQPSAPPAYMDDHLHSYELAYSPSGSAPPSLWRLPYGPNGRTEPLAEVPVPGFACQAPEAHYRELGTAQVPPGPSHQGARGIRRNYLELQLERCQKGEHLEMRLFPSFWDGAFVAVDSQCQVQIFCHELAHLAAGADDVSGDDETCYGMGGVRRAKANGVSACNAENLAMFALRFHPELAHLLPPRSRPPQ